MNKNPLVSIVIPTYNRKKLAERLIRSLIKSKYKNIELIVIDDASPDETSAYLKKKFSHKKNIKIYRNKVNMFAAGSKNVGQSHAKGELIMFIDDDNVVDKEMLTQLVSQFIANDKIGEVGPVNYNFNKKNSILMTRSTRNMWTTKTYHLRQLKAFRKQDKWATDDIPNAFMVRGDVVRKNKIQFREKFGIMYEESDYAYRIRKAGYEIYIVKDAKIYHDIEDSAKGVKGKDYMYHFMEDKRRPYVFARNRIIFHSLYSSKMQNLLIYSFWVWFFMAYYVFKFIFYSGYGDFSLKDKVSAAFEYIKGTLNGLSFALLKTYKI